MRTGLMLLMLTAMLLPACAETTGGSRNRNSIVDLAKTCATCGGAVKDDYFAGSAYKAVGPGSY